MGLIRSFCFNCQQPNYFGLFTYNDDWQYTTIELSTGNTNKSQSISLDTSGIVFSILNISDNGDSVLSIVADGNIFALTSFNSLDNQFKIFSNVSNDITFEFQFQPVSYDAKTNKAYYVSLVQVAYDDILSIMEFNFNTHQVSIFEVRATLQLQGLPIGVYDSDSNIFYSFVVDKHQIQYILSHSIATQKDLVNTLNITFNDGPSSLFYHNQYLYLCQMSTETGNTFIYRFNTTSWSHETIYSGANTYFLGMMQPFYQSNNYIVIFNQNEIQQPISIDYLNLDNLNVTTSTGLNNTIPKAKDGYYFGQAYTSEYNHLIPV
ncbi:hypothetical protein PPL_10067 [Heterostelium album PN500]|uniref:Uncharacterized protein n=1 Tax=Heterostelium pallidum (strain ATCC 26659 / Pp 5 / PN500) TaxID=670386 RepID=D3BQ84_HETP5|nr:hypothetical protein PPL_10067 [Heterostelium album PN500]EFA76304.1 hypothetical protein PPL_10067 [Heterostelium album PN500]|eukprot:XP_020428436.1 hypothetical protein PPL_10067 [Heterostelium album PN500]